MIFGLKRSDVEVFPMLDKFGIVNTYLFRLGTLFFFSLEEGWVLYLCERFFGTKDVLDTLINNIISLIIYKKI